MGSHEQAAADERDCTVVGIEFSEEPLAFHRN